MASDANLKATECECEEVCTGPLEVLRGHVPVLARRACFSDVGTESTEHVMDVEAIDTASSHENLTCADEGKPNVELPVPKEHTGALGIRHKNHTKLPSKEITVTSIPEASQNATPEESGFEEVECTYTVEVMVGEDIGLGLILDVGGNHATVAYVRPHGLLDRWNRRCEDSHIVRQGDVLIAVDDVARPAMELVSELHKHGPGPLRLTVACSQRFDELPSDGPHDQGAQEADSFLVRVECCPDETCEDHTDRVCDERPERMNL